jgi:hypothetical protein
VATLGPVPGGKGSLIAFKPVKDLRGRRPQRRAVPNCATRMNIDCSEGHAIGPVDRSPCAVTIDRAGAGGGLPPILRWESGLT